MKSSFRIFKGLGVLPLLFLCYSLKAQNLIHHENGTGFGREVANVWPLKLLNDSLILNVYYPYKANKSYLALRVLRTSDLSVKSDFLIDSLQGNSNYWFNGDFISDNGDFYSRFYTSEDSVYHSLISYNPILDTVSLTYKKNYFGVYMNSVIIDSLIYEHSVQRVQRSLVDTIHLAVRDFQANLLREHDIPLNDSTGINYFLSGSFDRGPYSHPLDSSVFLVGNSALPIFYTFTKNDLHPVGRSTFPTPNFRRNASLISNYVFDIDGYYAYGTGSLTLNPYTNPRPILQAFYARYSWRDSGFTEITTLGDTLKNERGWAFHYDPHKDLQLMANGRNHDDPAINIPEYRDIYLYRYNNHVRDSIFLFGSGNHVPYHLLTTSAGDVILLSVFTEAWTTQ